MPSERVQRRIDSLLDEAEAAADKLDWGLVAECARKVLIADANNEDGKVFLAMSEQEQSEPVPGTSLGFRLISLEATNSNPAASN